MGPPSGRQVRQPCDRTWSPASDRGGGSILVCRTYGLRYKARELCSTNWRSGVDGHPANVPAADRQAADAILAGVEKDRASAAAAIEPDPRLVYGVWGTAWLLGFGLLY